MPNKTFILHQNDIANKLTRLAYEIIEQNVGEKEIVLAGILPNGAVIATQLQQLITTIAAVKVTVVTIALNKKNPDTVTVSPNNNLLQKTIIIIDDVSMTGKTILYALQPFLAFQPKKIQTLVLVERQLKNFPIHSDFVGLHISTTLQELIIVEEENGILTNAYLI
jgi:pyrimidine operon attenuation protein / uracil phosphoribosyltransferase